MKQTHLDDVEHGFKCNTDRAEYFWHSGMCIVTHKPDHLLDEATARRVEAERAELCPEHNGTVLHVVPRTIEMFDQDALAFWMSREAADAAMARAVVVPSGITALRHRVRWMFFSSDIAFRVFRHPQVAKGWLMDQWLQHQELMLEPSEEPFTEQLHS